MFKSSFSGFKFAILAISLLIPSVGSAYQSDYYSGDSYNHPLTPKGGSYGPAVSHIDSKRQIKKLRHLKRQERRINKILDQRRHRKLRNNYARLANPLRSSSRKLVRNNRKYISPNRLGNTSQRYNRYSPYNPVVCSSRF